MRDSSVFRLPYSAFAKDYDALMSHIPYTEWAAFALSIIKGYMAGDFGHGLTILDAACGTGTATRELAKAGHPVVGLDLSVEMLAVANALGCRLHPARRPLFVQGDMTDLDFEDRFHAVTCFCDGLNHLDGTDALAKALASFRKAMKTGGVLVFDLNTPHKLRDVLGNNTFVEEFDGGVCIMDNTLREADGQVDIRLSFFTGVDDGLYRREDETHTETWFEDPVVLRLLSEHGFRHIGTWDGYGPNPITDRTERAVYAAVAV